MSKTKTLIYCSLFTALIAVEPEGIVEPDMQVIKIVCDVF